MGEVGFKVQPMVLHGFCQYKYRRGVLKRADRQPRQLTSASSVRTPTKLIIVSQGVVEERHNFLSNSEPLGS